MSTESAALRADRAQPQRCFHCAEPMRGGEPLFARIDGADQPMCCPGCKAVAEFISISGLAGFYSYRDTPSTRPDAYADKPRSWQAWDEPSAQKRILSHESDDSVEAVFLVEGIRCAACTWLIERSVGDLDGVIRCQANPATSKAVFEWDPTKILLSRILQRLSSLGFNPHPVIGQERSAGAQREQQTALRRLVVAGIGMMQVLMFAVALYAGVFDETNAASRDFLRLVSLLVATPVVIYSGFPFFQAAARDLRHGRPGMDVPVAIAIAAAYIASLWMTMTGGAAVYFDSATMFVFLLLAARYMEMKARHRSAETADALQSLLPQLATRIDQGGECDVPIGELAAGDLVLIRPGAIVPADGRVCWGRSTVDESMYTGEFEPRQVGTGEPLIAGSQNLGQPLQMQVERTGQQTAAAAIARMIEGAQARKPTLSRLADRVARWFVAGLLLLTAIVAIYWYAIDPPRAFSIALSLLVVTCPCALALATPTAFTAAMDRLARKGILVTNGDAIESLARSRIMLLDKTGTLTEGHYRLLETIPEQGHATDLILRVAASLEQASEHPVAQAFRPWFDGRHCEEFVAFAGEGVEGTLDNQRYRLGTPAFARAQAPSAVGVETATPRVPGELTLLLAGESGVVATFRLGDRLRPDAADAIGRLADAGIDLEIVSGAGQQSVAEVALESGIEKFTANLAAEDKLNLLAQRQASSGNVAMVGDGINDAPVLAAADVSVAMGSGTALAHASADIVILGDHLAAIPDAVSMSRKTLRVVRQNLGWAFAYNLLAIPAAAAGLVQPWMAAIGMSASSLIVVANSLRLGNSAAARAKGGPAERQD